MDVEDDPNEEDMDDVNLDGKRECHWRMMFIENYGGVDYAKALIHAKRWDVYVTEKENLVKGGYLVEFFSHDRNKVLWEVFRNNVVEEPTDNDEIGLRFFISNFPTKMRRG